MAMMHSKSKRQTQNIAALLADEVSSYEAPGALVIALEGDLGAGKTTFVQGFCRRLGVRGRIASPTFVLMKIYNVRKGIRTKLVHIDCYRLDEPRELLHLGLKDALKDPNAIILIEWADRIKKIVPKGGAIQISFKHGRHLNERFMQMRTI